MSIAQVSSCEIGTAQVSLAEIGTAQVGSCEVSPDEAGTAEIGTAEAGIDEVGTTQVGTAQVGTTQIESTLQPHFLERRSPKHCSERRFAQFLEGWNVGLKGSSHVFQMSDGQTLRIP